MSSAPQPRQPPTQDDQPQATTQPVVPQPTSAPVPTPRHAYPAAPATPTSPSPVLVAAEDALLATVGVPVERREVMVDGVRLHYLVCGARRVAHEAASAAAEPPLLLLHGRGCSGALFAPILAQLAAQREVIALDLPGWGLSDKPVFTGHSGRDALAVWVAGVFGFLDAVGLRKVDLLGHSMGGFTALGVALDHPDRVRRLILVDSGGLGRDAPSDVRLYFWLKPERLHRWFGRRFLRYVLKQDAPSRPISSGPFFEMMYALTTQPEVIPSGAHAFDQWVNLFGVHIDLLNRLGELQAPTLLLWGERDRVTRYHDALIAARHLPRGRLVAFSGCGHMPFVERPDDFARVLLVWLDGGGAPSRV